MKITLNKILILFLFFLPFTQVLTIRIGFNLKISEILIFFFLFVMLSKKNFKFDTLKAQDFFLVCFFVWAILSFIINSHWNYDYEPKQVPYRINRVGDSILRLVYIFLCIVAYLISCKLLSKKIELLDYWIKGAVVAAIYGWYLFISTFFDVPYLKLPGLLDKPQMLYGIIRSGTFLEGNFFGMFLVLSAAICFYREKRKIGWFLIISILSTFSTVSFISGLLFIGIFYFNSFLTKKGIKSFFIVLFSFLIITPFMINTKFFQINVKGKLLGPSDKITSSNFSSIDRSLTARIAYKAGLDNPFFGVGPYNYGNHYDEYNDIDEKLVTISDYFIDLFLRKEKRAIPNNVYMEVWAEYGIIGFVFYMLFLIKIIILSYKTNERAIFAGCMALLLSMNAFPSFIMLFIWVFLAIPVAIKNARLKSSIIVSSP